MRAVETRKNDNFITIYSAVVSGPPPNLESNNKAPLNSQGRFIEAIILKDSLGSARKNYMTNSLEEFWADS